MELIEVIKKSDGSLICSFYTKSKLADEVHGFKMSGKNAEMCIDAVSKQDVKSFKQIGKKDLEISYKHGKVIVRNYENIMQDPNFAGLNDKLNYKVAKIGIKKTERLLRKHKEYPKKIVKKANRVKSVDNYNKNATLSKKEVYKYAVIDDKTVCTYSGTSKLMGQKFSYTYSGPQANKTLASIAKNKVREFQNLDGSVMEVTYGKGKLHVDDFEKLFKTRAFKDVNSGIVKKANKLKHKDVRERFMSLKDQSKWVNRAKSIKNFGKKALASTTLCSCVLFGGGFAGISLPKSNEVIPTSADVVSESVADIKSIDEEINEVLQDEVVVEETKEEVKEEPKVEATTNDTNNNVYSKDYYEFNYNYRAASADKTRQLYQPIIEKYAKRYGLDSNVILGIAAHERGTHSSVRDAGGGIGLMQIQVSVWDGYTVHAYNYETRQQESIHITEDKLADVDFNIQVGCAIFQNNFKTFNYDPIPAIQAYNYGCGHVSSLMRNYGKNWLNKRDLVNGGNYNKGDHLYVEHVLSYIYSSDYDLKFQTPNGVKQLTIDNKALETTKTR